MPWGLLPASQLLKRMVLARAEPASHALHAAGAQVYVDTVGDASSYQQRLARQFPTLTFTVCPKVRCHTGFAGLKPPKALKP